MNSRERLLACVRHELPDRVPIDLMAIDIHAELADYLGVDPLLLFETLGLDRARIGPPYTGPPVEGEDGESLTVWGTVSGSPYHSSRWAPLRGVESVRQVEEYSWPDPSAYDFEAAAADARRLCREYAVRGAGWQPIFCRASDLLTMEGAMTTMVTNPAVFEAVIEQIGRFTLEYCHRLLDACGPALDFLQLGDDFASQRGMLISPECWRRHIKPVTAELFQLGTEHGARIWYHSCGNIVEVLPDLIDMGMDVWETVQLHTLPLSAAELKRRYGKHITFFGAICTQTLPSKTPDQVRLEVRKCIEVLGKGGGYICGPDHHVKPDVPPENVAALYDEARRFRATGCTAVV